MGASDLIGRYGGKLQIGELTTDTDGTVKSSRGSMSWARSAEGVYVATFEDTFTAIPLVVVDSPKRDKIAVTPAIDKVTLTVSDNLKIGVPIADLRIVDSNTDVGNIAAIGGVTASDTAPSLIGDTPKSFALHWATLSSVAVAIHVPIPGGVDGQSDVTVELDVLSGTTDAATFTVQTGWDHAALVSDSASDAATKSATAHTISATVAAADVPDGAKNLTLILTPAAHTTDVIELQGVRVLSSGHVDLLSHVVTVYAASSYESEPE